jgi:hypothetical protein
VERKVYLDINWDKGVLHDLFLQKIARRDNREEGGNWNLDHLLTCGIPYANTDGIPRNSGHFYCKKYRGIPYVYQKIPYSVGSQKRTSVDTLFVTLFEFLSLKNDVNVASKSSAEKIVLKN